MSPVTMTEPTLPTTGDTDAGRAVEDPPMRVFLRPPPYRERVVSAPSRAVPTPACLVTVADRVERRLTEVLAGERARWTEFDPDVTQFVDALAQLAEAGGKRIRPAFCYWAFVGAGGDPDDPSVVDVGVAFELLQAFALVHDDVMDGSATRRGARTAHLEFAARHRLASWRGEPRRFGEAVAILVGDLAHVYADRMLAGSPPSAQAVWHELRIELNIGQFLDVLGTARGDLERARAHLIARFKSGKYTIERPLHVGAALAGRLDHLEGPLSAFGDPLGEAFQLRDDILGAFGDERLTGKPVGDDLREGKPTPLLAIAAERMTPDQAAVLERVGDRGLSAGDVAAVQEVLVDTGALREVEATIEFLAARALGALDLVDLTEEARVALADLARFVAYRGA
jgi:geranylgeranyl diphosphate synthase type I